MKHTEANSRESVDFDNLPISRFHIRVTGLTFGAHFNDGFAIGIIGMAIVLIGRDGSMPLNAWWTGALGAGALFGLFVGALIFGNVADRIGRRKIFIASFVVICIATFAQFWVEEPWQLLALRIIMGLGIGGDYAVGHAMLAEILPRKRRGEFMGAFSVIWTFGYVLATILGIWFMNSDIDDAWRWMLIAPGVISIAVLVGRLGIPESPRWLLRMGRDDEARRIVDRFFGENVVLQPEPEIGTERFRALFRKEYLRRTVFNCVFFTCLVMPYFAIYTFLPEVLAQMGLSELASTGEGYAVEIYLNIFLLIGAVTGIYFTAKFTRRGFLLTSFVVLIASLVLLAFVPSTLSIILVVIFAVMTFTLSAVSNLVGVFPAESFPTQVRSSGIGLATATSRLGSVVSTFLLPIIMDSLGARAAMLILVGVLVVGFIVSAKWAPETKGKSLVDSGEVTQRRVRS